MATEGRGTVLPAPPLMSILSLIPPLTWYFAACACAMLSFRSITALTPPPGARARAMLFPRAAALPGIWLLRVRRVQHALSLAGTLPSPLRAVRAGSRALGSVWAGGGPVRGGGRENAREDEEEEELLRVPPLLPFDAQRVCVLHPDVRRPAGKTPRSTGREWRPNKEVGRGGDLKAEARECYREAAGLRADGKEPGRRCRLRAGPETMEASKRRGRKRWQRGRKWVLRAEGRSYGPD